MSAELTTDDALAKVRALVRERRFDEARAVVLQGLPALRGQLTIALGERSAEEALRLARQLLGAGWRDDVVIATLVAYADPEDPLTIEASRDLGLSTAFAAVGEVPSSLEAWQRLIALLVAAGRSDDALATLRRAAVAGISDPGPWRTFVTALADAHAPKEALRVALEAAVLLDDAELWGAVALIGGQLGVDVEQVTRARQRAERLGAPAELLASIDRARIASR